MTTLTKEIREAAITKALAAHFKAREAKLEVERTRLADAIFNYTFGSVEKQARKLPAGWVEKRDTLTISASGYSSCWNSDPSKGPHPTMRLSKERLFPYAVGKAFTIDRDHQFNDAAQAIVREHNAILTDKEDLRGKLRTILYSCTTLKQLEERWPEGVQFLPAIPSASRAVVPVTVIAEVNHKLGLKKQTRAATKKEPA